MLNLFLNIFVAELLWRQTLDKVNGCIPWVPNLMTLSHTSPFLILLWFNFIFDNFTHSCPEFCSSLIVQSRVVTIHNSYSLFKLGCIFLNSEYTRYCGKALLTCSFNSHQDFKQLEKKLAAKELQYIQKYM